MTPHQEDDHIVFEVSTTSKTSKNLRKPRKPHDLKTYVHFPGYIFYLPLLIPSFTSRYNNVIL